MSRRFGRNQRRKMREQLDALWYLNDISAKQCEQKDREIERLRKVGQELLQTINLTRRVLGAYFVTLPVQNQPCHTLPDDDYSRFSLPLDPRYLEDDIKPVNAALRSVELAIMKGDSRFDKLRQQAHIRFVSRAGEVGYAFTAGAFSHCPPEYVIETLSREMANHLADDPRFRSFTLLSDDNGWYAREARLRRRTYEPKP